MIEADDVVLDLAGFSIVGNTTTDIDTTACPLPTSCTIESNRAALVP